MEAQASQKTRRHWSKERLLVKKTGIEIDMIKIHKDRLCGVHPSKLVQTEEEQETVSTLSPQSFLKIDPFEVS